MTAKKRTIRDIRIKRKSDTKTSSHCAQKKPTSSSSVDVQVKKTTPPQQATRTYAPTSHGNTKNSARGGGRHLLWVVAAIAVLIAIFSIMGLFHRAEITLEPETFVLRNQDITIPITSESLTSVFQFDTMIIEDEITTTVENVGTQEMVSQKARGTIVVFNEESTPQRFIEETRFEDPEGRIYMIENPITVPAAQGDTPGSVEVMVFAKEAGESYNIGLTDFVIPGWRETNNPKFQTQYARSSSPMEDGFEGLQYTMNEGMNMNTIDTQAQRELEDRIRESLIKEMPSTHIMPEGGIMYQQLQSQITELGEGGAEITLRSQGEAIILHKGKLSKTLAEYVDMELPSENVYIDNWQDISLTMPMRESIVLQSDQEYSLTITGDIVFVYAHDVDALQNDSRGVWRRDIVSRLENTDGIIDFNVQVRPFWKPRLPESARRIDIFVTY